MPILRAESQRKVPKRYQSEHRVEETRVHEANTIRMPILRAESKRKVRKRDQSEHRVRETRVHEANTIGIQKKAAVEDHRVEDVATDEAVVEEGATEDPRVEDAAVEEDVVEEDVVEEDAVREDATDYPIFEPDSDSEHPSSESSVGSDSSDDEEQVQVLPKKRKCRGKTKIRQNETFNRRPEIFVIGHRAFRSQPHCTKIVPTISQLVLRNVRGPYVTYRAFPKDAKEECLRAFLLKYRWGNKQKVAHCSKVFHRIAGVRYSNILTKLRSDMGIKLGSNDPAKWKNFPPDWSSPEHWESMCDQFKSPQFRKKAIRNGQNRLKGGIRVYHRHGSSNTYNLARSMEKKLKRPVSFAEVFEETHLKKGTKEFCDPKAGEIPGNYKKLMIEEYGSDEKKWPRFDKAIWVQASGGRKRGRIYGVPSVIDSSKLPGCHKSFPVLDNIHSSIRKNSGVEQHLSDDDAHYAHRLIYDDYEDDDEDDDEEDDEDDDFDYVPRYEREKAHKLRKINDFDESEYDESEIDFEAPKSDESDDEEDEHCYWY